MSTASLGTDTVAALVEEAGLAPSMHNAQPWMFRYLSDRGTMQLRGDRGRLMERSDPQNRALHLGCGAALFNLRVAAARIGREAATSLLPAPDDPWLLAEVRLDPAARRDVDLAALHPAIRRRHTSRHPFTGEPVPEAVLNELREAALLEGARLHVPDDWHLQELLNLTHDAQRREALHPEVLEELARWTRTSPEDTTTQGEGIPARAFGPRQHDVTAPVRDFSAGRPVPGRDTATFEQQPCLVLLGTANDGPEDWLRAGQAMERVLLRATLDGLACSLTSQALEWPELRWVVRDPLSAMGFVQMVIRVGYGPAGHSTPRRPVRDVLEIV
ncbi:Acg family FMN-binding oxidoreductase [Streptomyces sp. NPDC059175]|uniref:Acg family FMN-binding oxidoreductase n=1 Tax=unclassified Streptomyces TaxID=2593676 RepID=UPI0036CAB6FF